MYENENIMVCVARLRRTERIKAASLLLNGHRANEGPLSALSQQFTPRRMKLGARCPLCVLGQRANIKQYTHTQAGEKKGNAEELLVENLQLRFSDWFPGVYVTFLTAIRNARATSCSAPCLAYEWLGLIQSDPRKPSG